MRLNKETIVKFLSENTTFTYTHNQVKTLVVKTAEGYEIKESGRNWTDRDFSALTEKDLVSKLWADRKGFSIILDGLSDSDRKIMKQVEADRKAEAKMEAKIQREMGVRVAKAQKTTLAMPVEQAPISKKEELVVKQITKNIPTNLHLNYEMEIPTKKYGEIELNDLLRKDINYVKWMVKNEYKVNGNFFLETVTAPVLNFLKENEFTVKEVVEKMEEIIDTVYSLKNISANNAAKEAFQPILEEYIRMYVVKLNK